MKLIYLIMSLVVFSKHVSADGEKLFSTGDVEGTYVVLNIKADDLKPLLPSPLTIDAKGDVAVRIFFGHWSNLRGTWPVFKSIPMDYLEAFVIIPNVIAPGVSGRVNFMPILYLNEFFPTIVGKLFFKYNKHQRDLYVYDGKFEVYSKNSKKLAWSLTDLGGGSPSFASDKANEVIASLGAPFVGVGNDGKIVCSLLHFEVKEITASDAITVNFSDSFLDGGKIAGAKTLMPLTEQRQEGHFKIKAFATLSFPISDLTTCHE